MQEKHPIVLFDGVCNLCNGTVDFLLKKDKLKQFRFVSLQSEAGIFLINKFNIPSETDSVILINQNRYFTESEAAIEIAKRLKFPWKLVVAIKIIPKKLRDKMYQWIAQNRYKWFGEKEFCRLPKPEEKIFFPDLEDLNF